MTAPNERIEELTRGMLRKRLFVVLSHGKKGVDLVPLLPAHLEYMIGLEKQELLFASGPLAGGLPGDGLTILRTTSLEETRAVAERDPFVVNGLRTFEIREWTVMEGSVGLKVNFSDRSVEIV
jgi:uncharacterized protein YciI